MRIFGGFKLPNLGNLGKAVLGGLTQSLKNIAGDFFKSGFEGAKRSLQNEISQKLGLPAPSQSLGARSPGLATQAAGGGLGDAVGGATGAAPAGGGAKGEMDKILNQIKDPEQKAMFKLQQEMQRQNMLFSMLSNLQQIQHDTRKAAVNNLRV